MNSPRKKAGRLPAKLERFAEALTRAINAAATTGAVNLADYLDASQIRLLGKLAAKAEETPRQFVQGIVSRSIRGLRGKEVAA